MAGILEKEKSGRTFESVAWNMAGDEQVIGWARGIVGNLEMRNDVLESYSFEKLRDLYEDDGSLKEGNLYNPAYVLALWSLQKTRIIETTDLGIEEGRNIERNCVLTEQRILRALRQYYVDPELKDEKRQGEKGKSAFFIQSRSKVSRDSSQNHLMGDVEDYFRAFGGNGTAKLRYELFESLPPFVAAQYEDGEDRVVGYVICAPIAIGTMTDMKRDFVEMGNSEMRAEGLVAANYARPRVTDALRFAKKIGVDSLGLGAWMAALTKHGEKLPINEVEVTTGHLTTTYAMIKTLERALEKGNVDLFGERVGIIGCGHIGSCFAKYLLEKARRGEMRLPDMMVLSDKTIGTAQNLARELREINPDIKILVTDKNEEVTDNCRVICGSATNDSPSVQNLLAGTIFVNDSEPPLVLPEVVERCGAIAMEPLLQARIGTQAAIYRRRFVKEDARIISGKNEYIYGPNGVGLSKDGRFVEFSCGVENLLVMTKRMKGKIGKITSLEEVLEVGKLVEEFGFEVLEVFRFWGKEIDMDKFDDIKRIWQKNILPEMSENGLFIV